MTLWGPILAGTVLLGVVACGREVPADPPDGDCDEKGRGSNRGWTAEVLVEASPHLQSADIADR